MWRISPIYFLQMSHIRKAVTTHFYIYLFDCPWAFLRRRKWQPTPVSLPGESQDGGAWWAAVYAVTQSRTWLKWLSMHACIWEGNGNPLQYSCLENPRTEEPGGLLSMGSHRVGHDWSDLAAAAGINWYFSLYIQNTWLDHFILNLSHHTFHHHQYCWKTKMEIE